MLSRGATWFASTGLCSPVGCKRNPVTAKKQMDWWACTGTKELVAWAQRNQDAGRLGDSHGTLFHLSRHLGIAKKLILSCGFFGASKGAPLHTPYHAFKETRQAVFNKKEKQTQPRELGFVPKTIGWPKQGPLPGPQSEPQALAARAGAAGSPSMSPFSGKPVFGGETNGPTGKEPLREKMVPFTARPRGNCDEKVVPWHTFLDASQRIVRFNLGFEWFVIDLVVGFPFKPQVIHL